MQRSRGEAHVPEKSYTFHPKASNALSLRILLANPPFTHTAGHACMKCMGKIDCAHTRRVRVQPSFRRDSIHESVCMQQVFTSRQRTGNRLVQNDIRFVFFFVAGHQAACSNSFQVIRKDMRVQMMCSRHAKLPTRIHSFYFTRQTRH